MVFWITAAALTLAVAGLLISALLRARADAEHPAAYDLRVYRDQLNEVDRDLARDIISPENAERIRAEVGRRVLAADAQLQKAETGSDQPRGATLALAGIVTAALVGGSLALYPVLGEPGARDLPLGARIEASDEARADRISQSDAEAKLPPQPAATPQDPRYAELIEKLRTTVKDRPDDLQGQLLLVRNEAALGNFKPAYQAQRAVIRIKGDSVTADDYTVLAELMISASAGYVSPQAEDALRAALKLEPRHKPARYYTGLMMIQIDRPDIAFRLWRDLLEEGPENAPWIPVIRDQIGELAFRAGVDYNPPAPQGATPPMAMGLPGPTAEDMQNAAQMTPQERQEMIRAMVSNLAERLASNGGSAQEWARLVTAQALLGERDAALKSLTDARAALAGDDAGLAALDAAAASVGLSK